MRKNRLFAQVLRAVEERGQLAVARDVAAALVTGEALQLAVHARPPSAPPMPTDLLPASLAGVEVAAGAATDYDALLDGAA